jgi:hypothetical protein
MYFTPPNTFCDLNPLPIPTFSAPTDCVLRVAGAQEAYAFSFKVDMIKLNTYLNANPASKATFGGFVTSYTNSGAAEQEPSWFRWGPNLRIAWNAFCTYEYAVRQSLLGMHSAPMAMR